MVKLQAKKINGNIIISEEDFEHLLNCLDNQKYAHELPCCGDGLAMKEEELNQLKLDNQSCIDDFNKQCRQLWLS